MIDNSGLVQNTIVYDGFGNITSESNASFGDRYKWTGREWDAEAKLRYNRARYYDPAIGRWISQDLLGFEAGDSNLYRYVNNQPVMNTDPSGFFIHQPTTGTSPLGLFFTQEDVVPGKGIAKPGPGKNGPLVGKAKPCGPGVLALPPRIEFKPVPPNPRIVLQDAKDVYEINNPAGRKYARVGYREKLGQYGFLVTVQAPNPDLIKKYHIQQDVFLLSKSGGLKTGYTYSALSKKYPNGKEITKAQYTKLKKDMDQGKVAQHLILDQGKDGKLQGKPQEFMKNFRASELSSSSFRYADITEHKGALVQAVRDKHKNFEVNRAFRVTVKLSQENKIEANFQMQIVINLNFQNNSLTTKLAKITPQPPHVWQ